MTPAIDSLKKAGVPFAVHQYSHDAHAESWGTEAADKLGLDPARVFKTLVVAQENGALAVGIVPVAGLLDLKHLARALGCKKAAMAEPKQVERSTGYVLGGVSPLGQKRRLATVIDHTAQQFETIFISAGRRGLEVEIAPDDLAAQLDARFAEIGKGTSE